MVCFSGLAVFFINTTDLAGEQKAGGAGTGGGDLGIHLLLKIGSQPVEAAFRLNQFVLELGHPAGMGKIAAADNGKPFFAGPEVEVFGIEVP